MFFCEYGVFDRLFVGLKLLLVVLFGILVFSFLNLKSDMFILMFVSFFLSLVKFYVVSFVVLLLVSLNVLICFFVKLLVII